MTYGSPLKFDLPGGGGIKQGQGEEKSSLTGTVVSNRGQDLFSLYPQVRYIQDQGLAPSDLKILNL
jgi:hypothetical protein